MYPLLIHPPSRKVPIDHPNFSAKVLEALVVELLLGSTDLGILFMIAVEYL